MRDLLRFIFVIWVMLFTIAIGLVGLLMMVASVLLASGITTPTAGLGWIQFPLGALIFTVALALVWITNRRLLRR